MIWLSRKSIGRQELIEKHLCENKQDAKRFTVYVWVKKKREESFLEGENNPEGTRVPFSIPVFTHTHTHTYSTSAHASYRLTNLRVSNYTYLIYLM